METGILGRYNCRPRSVRHFLAYSPTRLDNDHTDIYCPARLDPAVPIEETVGAIKEMIDAGHVRHIGLAACGVLSRGLISGH